METSEKAGISVLVIVIAILLFAPIVPRTRTELEPYEVIEKQPYEERETYTEIEPYTATKRTKWEVTWQTITGDYKWAATIGTSEFPSEFDYNWGTGKLYGDHDDYIGFVATATINVARSGPSSFTLGSDDGSKLYIDGREVIDNYGSHWYIKKTYVADSMSLGKHSLKIVYYDINLHARVSFSADRDLLTWDETEYREVQKERIVTKYRDVTVTRHREVTRTRYVSLIQLLTGGP